MCGSLFPATYKACGKRVKRTRLCVNSWSCNHDVLGFESNHAPAVRLRVREIPAVSSSYGGSLSH